MQRARRDILLIAALALLLLPACLAAWYFAAPALAWIPARLAAPVIGAAAGPVSTIAARERALVFGVTVEAPYRQGGAAQAAAELEVNPSQYTFGIAVFLALCLAARQSRRAGRIAIGCAVLAVLPAWGIAFDVLRQLGAAAALSPYLRWGAATRDAITFGYQLGSLILPTLAPIALWIALNRDAWRLSAAERAL
jgi:hypothetical protein